MAVAALALNAARAAALLRVQQTRERSRRASLARARQAREDALAAAHAAAAAVETGRTAGTERLRQAYLSLERHAIAPSDLDALPVLVRALEAENQTREQAAVEAIETARAADAAATAAQAQLTAAAHAIQRRSRLSERLRTRWLRAVDAAEEQARDEDVADSWSPA